MKTNYFFREDEVINEGNKSEQQQPQVILILNQEKGNEHPEQYI